MHSLIISFHEGRVAAAAAAAFGTADFFVAAALGLVAAGFLVVVVFLVVDLFSLLADVDAGFSIAAGATEADIVMIGCRTESKASPGIEGKSWTTVEHPALFISTRLRVNASHPITTRDANQWRC